MTIKSQSPPVLVEQYYSNGRCLVQISGVGKEFVTAADVVSDQEVVIPMREVGHNWYRIYASKT